ncbi:MAG: flagellar protein FlaG [Spongiibacteraceae bacterium]
MINDVVKNGYPPPAPVRTTAPAPSSLATDSSATTAKDEPVAAESATAQNAQPDAKQLREAVSKLNDYVQNIRRNLSFSVEETTGRTVVKVYDAETDELIRQIPSEETLRLAAAIEERNSSLFIQERT